MIDFGVKQNYYNFIFFISVYFILTFCFQVQFSLN